MNFGEWCYVHKISDKDLKKVLGVSGKKLQDLKKGDYTGNVMPLLKVMIITQGEVKIEEMIHRELLQELAFLSKHIKNNLKK